MGPEGSNEAEKNALLASVSRSFYLTIRALPKRLRHPIRTAYLLARATDTIADTPQVAVDERLKHLLAVKSCASQDSDRSKLVQTGIAFGPLQTNSAEKILIAGLPEIFADFDQLEEADRKDVMTVLDLIVRGQEKDLTAFRHVRALLDEKALDEYTYLVAGCVGEFWTQVCSRKLRCFSREPVDQMLSWGRHFGQGLQLVNILRDVRADWENGRCYLPLGTAALDSQDAALIYRRWLQRAALLLAEGWSYVLALKNLRLRFACALPILIGIRTLNLLTRQNALISRERVKVDRDEIKKIMVQTLLRAGSNRCLDRYRAKLAQTP
ncbi:MAG TPA: squalene/phytoene synthase family protein [Chthoniobacterales bacterium]